MTRVTVVVPTRNSARTIGACLRSIRDQTLPVHLVVVDNHSLDATEQIAAAIADEVVVAGPERSRQRNLGARRGDAAVVGFIDSDMRLEPAVVAEAVEAIADGAVAVIVPERTIGSGYWPRVRAFERSMYAGSDSIEAARFFRADTFAAAGGWDEAITGGEDWDLTIRVRRHGTVARTRSSIDHDEDRLTLWRAWRRMAAYAPGFVALTAKHGASATSLARDRPYLRRPWLLLRHPLLGLGLVLMKSGEATIVAAAILRRRRAPR